jgi:hypothetical protein
LSEAIRVDLVKRLPDENVGLRLQRMGLGQENRSRAIVVATYLLGAIRLRHPNIGLADDGHVVPIRLEGFELAVYSELEVAAHLRWRKKML